MFGWPTKTILAVVIVGSLMWLMLASEESEAGTYLGLGHTVANSSAEFYAKHYSSAGTFENNTGVDVVGVRFLF